MKGCFDEIEYIFVLLVEVIKIIKEWWGCCGGEC